MKFNLNLNYYIVGMLLVAVILAVSGVARRSGLVEGMLPFGQYRANTEYNNGVNMSDSTVMQNNYDSWNHHIPLNGGYKGFSYNTAQCANVKKFADSQYIYLAANVGGQELYLNFDSEKAPTGAVYFSPEKPDGQPSADYQMKSLIGKTTVTICKFAAQKWQMEMADSGLDNCEVYIKTVFADNDECPKDIPYYLSVNSNGRVYGSMTKGSADQRWKVYNDNGLFVLVNPANQNGLAVGSGYDRKGTFKATSMRSGGVPLKITVGGGKGQFTDWTLNTKVPEFVHYKPAIEDPQGAGAGMGGWSTRFANIWNGTYSGKSPIVVKLGSSANSGVVTVGGKSYNVKLMGSNMLVGKDSGGKIDFVGEMLSKEGELPRVKFYTIDGQGKYQNLSAKDSPDNLSAYSLYVANSDDYLASNGYGPVNASGGLGLPKIL